ncbi:baculoviral IAP repeat-containing protein 3-like isoform X2 [Pogonomyrmex barbatus]|nr:baculoviral IAP repeat-containing protein 3-like isoform X2 [Pogonomyrmex barbatus]
MTECIEHYMLPPKRLSSNSPISSHLFIEVSDEVDSGDYRLESARLESFKSWPCLWMKPEKLAAAGFYYTGESDKVKCFECQIEICEWQADDNPMVDHQRWSGRCRFVRNIPCGNVPIGTDPNTIPAPTSKGVDVCGPYGSIYMPYSGPDHEDQEIEERVNYRLRDLASRPKHPEYASYAARLASFDTWPKSMTQTKEELANAGFYYTGCSDQTLCYHCGGGLRDWEPEDDPWMEHAKWFENCHYLILTKGTEFVSNVTGKRYSAAEKNISIDKFEEKYEKADSESNASGSSQNSINSEEGVNHSEASSISGEAYSEEQVTLQAHSDKPIDKDARLCKICYNRELRMLFMPCGHLLACAECAKNMKVCGVCRKPVEVTVQAYIS